MDNSSWKDARPLLMAGAMMLGAPAVAADDVDPTADVPMAEGWRMETVVEGLENPWGMAFLPNGDILVTERPGRLRLVRDGELVEDPIEGVPEVLAQNQGGLLDIVLHPQFEQNRYVYLTYASGSYEENRTTLTRGTLEGDRLLDVEVLFQVEPDKAEAQHFGSRLAWLPDGTLLMSVGDGGNPPLEIDGTPAREHAQRLDSHLGKILRFNDDGSVPEDNPFVDRDDARPEIFSYGHRNIQGLAYDADNDRVWVSEHGPLGGDELNRVQRGANHGWPLATYGADYRTGERFTSHRTLEDAVGPKAVWTPAVAPSGLMVYTGDRFSAWRGNLFSGGLVGQDVRRIILDGEDVQGQETLPIASRVRSVTQGPDGYIYVLTDEEEGELLRLEPQQ